MVSELSLPAMIPAKNERFGIYGPAIPLKRTVRLMQENQPPRLLRLPYGFARGWDPTTVAFPPSCRGPVAT